jgi:hypothetical protein
MLQEVYKDSGSPSQRDTKSIDDAYLAQARKREIAESILVALKEHAMLNDKGLPWSYSGMPRLELFQKLKEGYGLTVDEFDKIVDGLIRKGEIYEPRPNFIKRC